MTELPPSRGVRAAGSPSYSTAAPPRAARPAGSARHSAAVPRDEIDLAVYVVTLVKTAVAAAAMAWLL
ncbi:hypothetical protein, partial [Streptomyces zhihengii]